MYLKSLEVHGFKSFANKLVFEFHNGITAIVGPNGSGKSNVADAVRWVLGEQSARQLRGNKMEDVIFAGTELRKPLGYAYVAITISNEDHKLDVPYEEVTIARRVYRSGESEYLLNGTVCRLKDVQELLFDTGIGKEGYSIIGQGQIDKILSGRPEERRELFDEAAGIVKYKKRKAAAEKNLEEEQQNLIRIEDILSEIEKQVGPLQLEAEKAKEYLKYREHLKKYDVTLFLMEYDRIQEEEKNVQDKKAIVDRDYRDTKEQFEKTKTEYEETEQKIEQFNDELEQKRERLTSLKVLANEKSGEIKVLEEQINTIKQDEFHYRDRVKVLKNLLSGLQSEKEKQLEEKRLLQKEEENLKEDLEKKNRQIQEMKELEEASFAKKKEQDQSLLQLRGEVAETNVELQRYQTLFEQNTIKRAEMTKQVLKNKSEASALEEIMTKKKQELQSVDEKMQTIVAEEEEIKKQSELLNEDVRTLRADYQEAQKNYHIVNSKLQSLKNMTERYEGFGQSIRRVMEQKEQNPGIIGVVADIIRVKKDYELAIETALGGSIQNIVTDDEQTAKKMIGFLKKNKYGRATFLPLTNMKPRSLGTADRILSEPGVIGMGSSLVEADERFNDLVSYLLGRFVVVDEIDHAIALANKYHHTIRIVTKEGDLLNPGGSMSGGAFRNNNNLLGRRREMEKLEEQAKSFKNGMERASLGLQEQEKEQEKLRNLLAEKEKRRQECQLVINAAKINYDRAAADLESNQEELKRIRLENQGIEGKKDDLKKTIALLEQQISDKQEEVLKLENSSKDALQKEQEQKEQEGLLVREITDCQMKMTGLTQKEQFCEQNLLRIDGEKRKHEDELLHIAQESENVGQRIQEKNEQIVEVQKNVESCHKETIQLQKEMDDSNGKKEELNKKQKSFFDKREELSNRMSNLDKETFRLQGQVEKMQEQLTSYTNYMWEQYELTYHGAEEIRIETTESLSEVKKQIASLKSQIKQLGNVNVNAVEQYKEIKERYELLHTQHEDLIKAADMLKAIILELDEGMRKQFEEQFGEIKKRFDAVFKELFGGGKGTLELTDEEDILLAGIRVIAQPPGKKLQNMMQLSGGEKALTAIALLFAIQSLKPSPFCLLDEIEAALDDSNVARYADYLHKLTKDTQFIVITHRRGTMNAADVLYGITMQEKGVSTLVSVSLLDEKEMVE